jgi:predicted nucleic acid-binding protein
MGFVLDTNTLSDLVRRPRGRIADRIAEVGERHVCTSIIVAAELRYGAAKKASARARQERAWSEPVTRSAPTTCSLPLTHWHWGIR